MDRRTSSRKVFSGRRSSARLRRAINATCSSSMMAVEALEPRRLLSWTPGDGAGWIMGGTGDFNGDGYADIVWRNQPIPGSPTPGEVRIQYMQGNSVLSVSDVTVNGESFHTFQPNPNIPTTASNPNFIVPATGEFNLSNSPGPEIVVLNGSTKWVYLWGMNGSERTVSKEVGQLNNSQWYIVGTGDFDGDGMDDILWWNSGFLTDGTPVAGGGNLGIWRLNQNHVPSWLSLTTPGGGAYTMSPSTWRVAGVADFDGDGTPDVAWQKKAHPAELRVWSTSGSNVISSTTISGTPGTSGIAYQMQGIADMDGNGTLDFLLRQMAGPNNYVWHTSTANPMQWSSTGALGQAPSLTPPVLQAPTGVTGDQVTLQWNDVSYETGYEIWSKRGSGDWQLAKAVGPNVTSTTIDGLWSETQYAFQVRAKTASAGDQTSNTRSAQTAVGAITWTGAGGDNLWSNPANWHTNVVPGSLKDVRIPSTAGNVIVDGVQEINSLIVSGTVQVEGTLKVLTTAVVNDSAVVELQGGSLLGGNWQGPGNIAATAGGTLDGVTLQVNINVPAMQELAVVNGLNIAAATVDLTGPGMVQFAGTQSVTGTSGTLRIHDSAIDIDGGALTIENGVTIAGSGVFSAQAETGTLINKGVLRTGTSGVLNIGVSHFENQRLVKAVPGGELRITAGTWENTATGEIDGEGGGITLDGVWVNTGTFVWRGEEPIAISGTIDNRNGAIEIYSFESSLDAIIIGGRLDLYGVIANVSGAWHDIDPSGRVTISDGKTLEIYGGFHTDYMDVVLGNHGTVRFVGTQSLSGPAYFYMGIEHEMGGTIEIDGTLTLDDGFIAGQGLVHGVNANAALYMQGDIAALGDLTFTLPTNARHMVTNSGVLTYNGVIERSIVVMEDASVIFNGQTITGSVTHLTDNLYQFDWSIPVEEGDITWLGTIYNLTYQRGGVVGSDFTWFADFEDPQNSVQLLHRPSQTYVAAIVEKPDYTVVYAAMPARLIYH